MTKKEYRDILKRTLVILSVLSIIPLIYIFDRIKWKSDTDYLGIFIIAFGVIVLFIANRLGAETFRTEHDDNAFEYLLTLPISKGAIILKKLIPRLVLIIPPVICYEVLMLLSKKIQVGGVVVSDFFIFRAEYFPLFVIFLLLFSFFTSLFGKKNFMGLFTIAALIVFALTGFALKHLLEIPDVYIIQKHLAGLSFLISFFIVDLIIAPVFWVVFKKFDVKSLARHGEKFVLIALVPLILVSIAAIFILLTSNHTAGTV
jgi:hypothetical protein